MHSTIKRACLGIHHLIVVLWKVGDDHFEWMQQCQGARRGKMQVGSHMVIQNMERQLPPCSGNTNLSAEVIDSLPSNKLLVGGDTFLRPHS